MKHQHFETEIVELINTSNFDAAPRYAVRVSNQPEKWMWVASDGKMETFATRAEAELSAVALRDRYAVLN